jgi:DNA-binding MarR family transcriptional regulator
VQVARSPDPADELVAAWRAELPDVVGPETELVKRVTLLATTLGEAVDAVLPDLGLTPAEFDVLAALRRAGPPFARRPNDLTRALLLSSGGTSNVVNRLAARGLVARQPDPDDRRGTLVVLTADGVALAEEAVRVSTAAHATVLAAVPEPVLAAAADALREVFASVGTIRRPAAPAVRRPRQPGTT